MSYFEAGRIAAQHIWLHWRKPTYVEPEDPMVRDFAEGALLEFERLQEEAPGILHVMAEGAHKGAQQLNLDDYHGVMEVLQNADDLFASEVVISLQQGQEHDELLIVHDGEPVAIQHVLAMTYAFISTKGDDSRQKGKFGVGLKTLGRIADRMEVHSGTYSFAVEEQRIRKIDPCPPINGLYRPGNRATLLRLRLFQSFDKQAFSDWFSSLDASVLLFLDTVKSFRLILNPAEPVFEHVLINDGGVRHFKAVSGRTDMEVFWFRCSDRATGRAWTKFQVEIDVPKKVSRSHKKTGDKTRLALALPDEPSLQRIYAGLPTYIRTQLPFSLDAQFDPDTSREALLHNAWNKWLLSEIGELVSAVAVNRFMDDPARAWDLMPLAAEINFADLHLKELVQEALLVSRETIIRAAVLAIDKSEVSLPGICFECEALEGLLDAADYPLLCEGKTGLPQVGRDMSGRWRDVLKEIDCCEEITVEEGFRLFSSEEACSRKEPAWFVDYLIAALETSTISPIFVTHCLLLESGSRIPAQRPGSKTAVLVRSNQDAPLAAFELAHALHSAYFARPECRQTIEKFLLESTNYTAEARPADLLTAFANRYEATPIKLSDRDFIEVKSLYDSIAPYDFGLGLRVGRSILVDGYHWYRMKKVRCEAPASICYLPAGLVKDKAGHWAVAADKTPGIVWVSSRYKELFRGRRKSARDGDESVPRSFGVWRFLKALGAEVAPRIEACREMRGISVPLPRLQHEAVIRLSNKPTHIEGDYVSSVLDAVVANICTERKKSVRKLRGVALFEAISNSWERFYSEALTCSPSYFYYSRKYPGNIPATWIARLASQPWLTNLNGEPKAPMDLVIRTSATRAVYGDAPKLFAFGLDDEHCQSEFPAAMGMETNPRASGIVEQIRRMRDGSCEFDLSQLMQLYGALAEIARRVKSPVSLSSPFDDLSVARLRLDFGADGGKGLLYIADQWTSPDNVLCGRDIFRGRRLFAPAKKRLETLWKVLGLRQPGFEDCLGVLRDVSKAPLTATDEALLIDTYRQLSVFVAGMTTAEKRRLADLPLWCHGKWVRSRPVYMVSDSQIARNFSRQVAVWCPPCSFDGMPKLLEALKVTVIDPREFRLCGFTSSAAMAGDQERPRFMQAVTALEEHFARTDEALYKSITVSWESLKQAPLYIATHLAVEWNAPGMSVINSGINAHGSNEPIGLYFSSADEIGEKDAGGRMLAECFFPESFRQHVAVSWVWAWQESMKVKRHELSLAREEEEEPADVVAEAVKKCAGKTSTYERGAAAGKNRASAGEEVKVERKLKDFSQICTVSVSTANSGSAPGGYKEPARKGLKRKIPPAPLAGGTPSGTSTGSRAIITYTTQELEEMALRCLHHALRHGDLGELEDFRSFRGIGADAAIELKKFFEIKASACEMPDRVELTLNELDRARLSSDSFYLVVVSGLEEGYETVLHLYKNPLRTLDWSPSGSVVISGLKSKQADQVKLLTGPGPGRESSEKSAPE